MAEGTFIISPTLQIILKNNSKIMTAYNNLLAQYSSNSINSYYLAEFSDNAAKNNNTDLTYYNDYENGQITAEVLADDYLSDLYTNIYSISSTSPLLTEITNLESVIVEIQDYYNEPNWYAVYLLNSSQAVGNTTIAIYANPVQKKDYPTLSWLDYLETTGAIYRADGTWAVLLDNNSNYREITQLQIKPRDEEAYNVAVNILVMEITQVQVLENQLNNMITSLEEILESIFESTDSYNSLISIIDKLNTMLETIENEINNVIAKIIKLA